MGIISLSFNFDYSAIELKLEHFSKSNLIVGFTKSLNYNFAQSLSIPQWVTKGKLSGEVAMICFEGLVGSFILRFFEWVSLIPIRLIPNLLNFSYEWGELRQDFHAHINWWSDGHLLWITLVGLPFSYIVIIIFMLSLTSSLTFSSTCFWHPESHGPVMTLQSSLSPVNVSLLLITFNLEHIQPL